MAGRSPSIKVNVFGDASGLKKAFADAEQQSKSFGDKMSKMGGQLTRNVTLPLVALAGVAVKKAVEQEKAVAKLTSTFESMGAASWTSVDALTAQAAALQRVTTFGDEAIIVGQSLLLTFGNIKGQEFDRATKAMLDMSLAMDQGLKESAIQLGKALNDPIAGLAALGRVGIQFSGEQKTMIRSMVAVNDVVGAQKVILEELEHQFGGTAEAVAKTAGGKMTQAMNDLGDAMEVIGAELLPVLAKVADGVGGMARAFGELPGPVKTATVELILFAALLGPLMKMVGVISKAVTAVRGLGVLMAMAGRGAGLGIVGGPFGVAAAAALAGRALFGPQDRTMEQRKGEKKGGLPDVGPSGGTGKHTYDWIMAPNVAAQRSFFNLERTVVDTAQAMDDLSFGANETARFFRLLDRPVQDTSGHLRDAMNAQAELNNQLIIFANDESAWSAAFESIGLAASATADDILDIKAALEGAEETAIRLAGRGIAFDPTTGEVSVAATAAALERRRRETVDAGGN